jgi:hypothetical protein
MSPHWVIGWIPGASGVRDDPYPRIGLYVTLSPALATLAQVLVIQAFALQISHPPFLLSVLDWPLCHI